MKTISTIKRNISVLACVISMTVSAYSQVHNLKYENGLVYRKERDYEKGFTFFSMLLKTDSANVNYLVQASYFYGRFGFFVAPKKEQLAYFTTARRLAERALAADNNNAEAHYVYAMSLSYLAQVSDMKFRLTVGRTIKQEAELAVKLNPRNAAALHMIGRWHMIVAGFNGVQRTAVKCVAPDLIKAANFNDALKYLTMAQFLEPTYKPHMVALAETYYKMGLESNAIIWLNQATAIISRTHEDRLADTKCRELAAEMGYDLQEVASR